MSVRKDLMAEIEAKAKKIKAKKAKAKSKTELEKLVFDFFSEAESLGKMKVKMLLHQAGLNLQRNIANKLDPEVKVEVIYTDQDLVQGVVINWSKSYQISYKTEEQFYVGVEEMLFN